MMDLARDVYGIKGGDGLKRSKKDLSSIKNTAVQGNIVETFQDVF